MGKRYLCFTCYQYHPEMRGVSEDEFNAGSNTCQEEKCICKGQTLEAGEYCKECDKMYRFREHQHV